MLTQQQEMDSMINAEEMPLGVYKTVFPFTLFPDSVEIYRNKVVLIRRFLPLMKKEFPILISDIKTVTVTTGPFFASVFFEIKAFEQNPEPISHLKRNEALEVRRLVTGLSIIDKNDISTDTISKKSLLKTAIKIG